MSIDGRVDKDNVVHVYSRMLLIYEKEGNSAICENVDGPRGH